MVSTLSGLTRNPAVFIKFVRLDWSYFLRLRKVVFPLILSSNASKDLIDDLSVVRVDHNHGPIASFFADQQLCSEAFVCSAMTEISRCAVLLDKESQSDIVRNEGCDHLCRCIL